MRVDTGAPGAAPTARLKAYFAALPPATRARLTQVRDVVRAVVPDAEETFAYGIPAFTLDGKPLVYYAGWKKHISLYPMTEAIRTAHAAALAGYTMSKGTIRFPLEEPLPVPLVKKLVKARVGEVRAAGAKTSRTRPAR